MTQFNKFASVVLDMSVHKALDYGIPADLLQQTKIGMRVKVPVRGSLQTGYIIDLKETSEVPRVLPIKELLSETEILTKDLLSLGLWMAKYYASSLRQVLRTMVPAPIRKKNSHKEQQIVRRAKTREELKIACKNLRNRNSAQSEVLDAMLKVTKEILLTELLERTQGSRSPILTLAKKGLLALDTIQIDRSPLADQEYFKTKPKQLNEEQQRALDAIIQTIQDKTFASHLVFGVTGSGKTEIYLQAIEKALSLDRGAIVLVPEVSLTTQLVERFRSRFDHNIAVLHHRLSDGERYDEWHRIRRGEAKIAIGARSVVFSPVQNLGIIIVDEEHEPSYKQSDEMPCYNGRDVAVMRANLAGCAAVLGSATPSFESYTNAINKKYLLQLLETRADNARIPKITIIDMQKEDQKNKGFTSFSEELLEGIKKRKQSGEQTILFLNRRGYHTTLLCQNCKETEQCPHCDLALTFHKNGNQLRCHICGYTLAPPPRICRKCNSESTLKFKGIGTEQIENTLHAIFPDIRTLRVDADTTKHKGSHEKLLRGFKTGKADVLIGTQMIAKGLHFPEVTLVGILNSDIGLHIPDFRASETLFQLVLQVAGRAGRGALPGEVLVQTRTPENSTIRYAVEQNFRAFYEEESGMRKLFGYPPFSKMAKIIFSGTDADKTFETAENIRRQLAHSSSSSFEFYPVSPCGYAKVKDRYRFQFLIKGRELASLAPKLENLPHSNPKIRITVDIDPANTFF